VAKKIWGYAATFNDLSDPIGGQFREIIRPGAFRKSLMYGSDICALVDHDPAKILGRKSANTLIINEDSRVLSFEIPDPPDTSYGRDIMESLKRGDIVACSFGFSTIEDDWFVQDGESIRELIEVDIFDVSLVTYPAYPSTSVGLRTKEDKRRERGKPLSLAFARLRLAELT
jgi:HK97 family phage prohead protease